MKKVLFSIVMAIAILNIASAQKSAITNAILNLRSGNLDKALAYIEQAVINEKTIGTPQAWFTRGQLYEFIRISPDYAHLLKQGEGLTKAFESYAKTIELEGKEGEFGAAAYFNLGNLYAQALNDAVKYYDAGDFDNALSNFQLAGRIRPGDTTALLNTAYTYEAKKDLKNARSIYHQLLSMDSYRNSAGALPVYTRLLILARQENNHAEAKKVIGAALTAFPTNTTFLIEDLNTSLQEGNANEAFLKINKALAADPGNANLYAVRGSLYDGQQKKELAQADYLKAIELDAQNFDALYNVGVYQFNLGSQLMDIVLKMDEATYRQSGAATQAAVKEKMEIAAGYLEKALRLKPTDKALMQALQTAYSKAGRVSDAARMQEQLNGLK